MVLQYPSKVSEGPFPWKTTPKGTGQPKEIPVEKPTWFQSLPFKLQQNEYLQSIMREVSALDCISFRLPAANAVAGVGLKHSVNVVDALLERHAPAIFKIGLTHNPAWRWANDVYGYSKCREQWSHMLILSISDEPFSIAMLEAALINQFHGISVAMVVS